MKASEYLEKSGRTNLSSLGARYFADRVLSDGPETVHLLHATMGISTEAGELLDVMKKHLAYGRSIDKVNIAEEVGDVLWYVAIILRELNMTFEQVMEMNINKLQKRFPDKFTEEEANTRNLTDEREQLEKDFKPRAVAHIID